MDGENVLEVCSASRSKMDSWEGEDPRLGNITISCTYIIAELRLQNITGTLYIHKKLIDFAKNSLMPLISK